MENKKDKMKYFQLEAHCCPIYLESHGIGLHEITSGSIKVTMQINLLGWSDGGGRVVVSF